MSAFTGYRDDVEVLKDVVCAFLKCQPNNEAPEADVEVVIAEANHALVGATLYQGLLDGRFTARVENGKVLWDAPV